MDKMTAEQALERFRQDLLPDPHDERDIDASWIRRRWERYEPIIREALSAPRVPDSSVLEDYDSGLLNDYGGGNVGWWQDYIRHEVDAANQYWREQVESMLAASPEPVASDAPSIDDYESLCAAMYQAAGARNLPVRFLDVLSAAQSGEPFAHLIHGLLPVSEDEEGAFCQDSNDAARLREGGGK